VTPPPSRKWRKASRSASNAGQNCLEVSATTADIALRDSKHRAGGYLTVNNADWAGLLSALKDDFQR